MFSKWTKKEPKRPSEYLERPFYESPSSPSGQCELGPLARTRSSSAATVQLRISKDRKWSCSPMADRRAVECEGSTRPEVAVSPALSSNRLLTVDSAEAGGKRHRGRSMSARKPNELRPHLESASPKQPAGGSVRVRRTSEMVNEIGQLKLTPVQVTLVRKLWQIVRAQGKNGAGLQILRDHLFFRYPDIRDLFTTGSNAGDYHKRLMAHAEALGDLLDEVIGNLEHADSLRAKIREVGKLHIKWRDMGFKAVYWDSLAEALNDCTLTWCQKAQRRFETQVAMTTIVMFIIDNLKDGYMEECRRLRRSVYEGGSRDRNHVHAIHEKDAACRSPRHLT